MPSDDLEHVNLLAETLDIMATKGKTPADVRWVGDRHQACDWHTFAARAADFTYDGGFGNEEVNLRLMVVGDDWWLERHDYDGSEWWEFKTVPTRPTDEGCPDIEFRWSRL